MLKALPAAIGGISKRTKGIAIKIPGNDFKLSCEKLSDSQEGCKELIKQLEEVKKLVKTKTGVGLKDYVKDDSKWTKDSECGNINWSVEDKDSNTNLLWVAKFLLRVYCFEAREKNKGLEFKQQLISKLSGTFGIPSAGELIGGIFNTDEVLGNVGKALTVSEIDEQIKKLIRNEDSKISNWIQILSELLSGKKLNLFSENHPKHQDTNKWLVIQKINNKNS